MTDDKKIPVETDLGPRALPTPTGDGVLHIFNSEVHQLDYDDTNGWEWETWQPKVFTSDFQRRSWFTAMYIPEEYVKCH